MAPPRRWTRQSWIETAWSMLGDGTNLGEVRLQQLFEKNGAAKNSFYNNFAGGLPELHAEVIARWKAERVPQALEAALEAVESPDVRLRLIRALLADTAGRDEAMRRWAVTDENARQAVAEGDDALGEHVIGALRQLGYDTEARNLAAVIVSVVQVVPDDAYDALIRVLAR